MAVASPGAGLVQGPWGHQGQFSQPHLGGPGEVAPEFPAPGPDGLLPVCPVPPAGIQAANVGWSWMVALCWVWQGHRPDISISLRAGCLGGA